MPPSRKLFVGYTACYPHYRGFNHLCDIPKEAALAWVQSILPDADMGGGKLAKDIKIEDIDHGSDGWLGRLYVIVAVHSNNWVALYKSDSGFSVQTKKFESKDLEDE